MKTTLVIMAAGMGSRYGGIKQIDSFGPHGEAIMDYAIHDALEAGFDKVICIIRKEFEEIFQEKIVKKWLPRIEIQWVFQTFDLNEPQVEIPERTKPWGTVHALLSAQELLDTPSVVINADDYYGKEAFHIMHDFLIDEVDEDTCGMVGYVLKNTLSDSGPVNRGVCSVKDGYLNAVTEHYKISSEEKGIQDGSGKILSADTVVSMNFWGFHHDMLPLLRQLFVDFVQDNYQHVTSEYIIPDAVDELIQNHNKRCRVMTSTSSWLGVTYQEDKEPLQKSFALFREQGIYPLHLEKN